jgi:hypothetical protein
LRWKSEHVRNGLIQLSAGLGYDVVTLWWLNGSFVCAHFLAEGKRHRGEQQSR